MTWSEKVARLRAIAGEMEGLAAKGGDLTADEERRFRALSDEFNQLDRDQTLDRVRAAAGSGSVEGAPEGEPTRRRAGGERGRALDMLATLERSDTVATREGLDAMARLIEGEEGSAVSRYVAAVGSPAYRSAFLAFCRDPQGFTADLTDEERAAWRSAREYARTEYYGNTGYEERALGTSGASAMIPLSMDTSIQLTNTGTSNANLREAFTVKQITGLTYQGVTSAGVTAEWKAEAAQAADASPTMAGPQIATNAADAFVVASYEAIQDAVGLEAEVLRLIQDAKDRLEATAFIKGTGSGQPKGLVTALVAASKTVGTAAADTLALDDIRSLKAAVPARWRSTPGAAWLVNDLSLDDVGKKLEAITGTSVVLTNGLLLNRKVYETSELDRAGATAAAGNDNVAIFGDLKSAYTCVDRLGLTVKFVSDVFGANGRPTGQSGWFAFWRVGGDSLVPDAARLLRA